jgi:hypothetical protein
MSTIVISYSYTGNNEGLAASLAAAYEIDHIRVAEAGRRTFGTIALDQLFNRTPAVTFSAEGIEQADLVLFVAPVWMGKVASPMRGVFKQLKSKIGKYAFIAISGGADGDNPTLASELEKRLGKAPVGVIDLHIADLLPQEPKPTRDDTSAYRITESDKKQLTDTIVASLKSA